MSNKQIVVDIPGVNSKSGMELCDGDFNIYLHSLRLFVTNIPPVLEKIKVVSKETLHDYAIGVHGAKSVSEYIGAEEAHLKAKQLEFMAKNGDLSGILAQNEDFVKYIKNLVDNINSWLSKNNYLSK